MRDLYLVLILSALAILCILAVRTHIALRSFARDFSSKYNDLKRLLFDLRDGTKTFYEERRTSQRIKEGISIRIGGEYAKNRVEAVDISENGASFRLDRGLSLKEIVELTIQVPLFVEPLYIKARVVRSKPVKDNGALFDTGVEFLTMSDPDRQRLLETMNILNSAKQEG